MNFKTKLLLKLQYDFNQNIINKKLVGHGVSRIENDLINKITISENIELDISLDDFIKAQQTFQKVEEK